MPLRNLEKEKSFGELLSADTVGLFVPYFSGCRYLIAFNDFKQKTNPTGDVLDCLKAVLNHAKTVGHPIREFLSDRGGNSDNLEVKKLLHEQSHCRDGSYVLSK